ncbi:hypothetical protein [Micromonospora sp. CB01531]|nr:hypothetical protein [Micromonospora sp. CB01531]
MGIFASVTRARLPDPGARQIAADGDPFGRGHPADGHRALGRMESIYVG